MLDVAKRRLDVELSDAEITHAAGSLEGARTAVQDRRDGEVRADGVVGVHGSDHGMTTSAAEIAEHAGVDSGSANSAMLPAANLGSRR